MLLGPNSTTAVGPPSEVIPINAESHDPNPDNEHEHPWLDAAIEAEFETGRREDTVEEARSHILVRLARMTFGFLVLIIGIIAIPAPGPGLLIVAAGLAILARDVAWAYRLLHGVRERLPSDSDGKLPRSTIVTMVIMTTAALTGSVWFMLR